MSEPSTGEKARLRSLAHGRAMRDLRERHRVEFYELWNGHCNEMGVPRAQSEAERLRALLEKHGINPEDAS